MSRKDGISEFRTDRTLPSIAHNRREYAYKSILSLNNTGVFLLANQNYIQAACTFKDAIQLMRWSFFSGNEITDENLPSNETFERALIHAWHRTRGSKHSQDYLNLVVLSDKSDPRQVYEGLNRDPESLFCVVIETDSILTTSVNDERLELDSGLLLYNYGVAQCCAARADVSMDSVSREQVHDAAQRIFELAQIVVTKETTDQEDYWQGISSSNAVLLLQFLVVASLWQMSFLDHNQELCQHYRHNFLCLLAQLAQQEETEKRFLMCAATA